MVIRYDHLLVEALSYVYDATEDLVTATTENTSASRGKR